MLAVPHHARAALYNASGLLGQYDSNGNANYETTGVGAIGFATPESVAIDTLNHRLFVSDNGNNRVLVFQLDSNDDIASTSASYVLGEPNFTSSVATTTQSGMDFPNDLAYDPVHQRLFVGEYYNKRVTVFNVATSTITNGENASYVLGEPDFQSVTPCCAVSSNRMGGVHGLAYDPTSDRLFVGDSDNFRRVMLFDVAPADIHNGEDAENVLGQSDFISNATTTPSQSGTGGIGDLAYDASSSRLFVADLSNDRVLVFDGRYVDNHEW